MSMSLKSSTFTGKAVQSASRASAPARKSVHINALKVGDTAPSFALKHQKGKTIKLGKGNTVVYFYPAANSPGCTKEAKAFKDSFADFKKKRCQVIGISTDTIEAQDEFSCELGGLPFDLLADEDGSVRQAYQVPKTLGLQERGQG